MEREVRYCTTEDGVRIAYCLEGEGTPLLWCPIFVESFSLADPLPVYGQLLAELSQRWMVVRYDARGIGLSDRDVSDFSGAALTMDIRAVAEAAGLERFALWGNTLSGPRAITYASAYANSVSHLVLYDTFSRADDAFPIAGARALADLARSNWKLAARALADMANRVDIDDPALSQFHARESAALARLYEQSTDGHTLAAIGEEMYKSWDVSELLPGVSCPVLVVHHLDNPVFPLEVARKTAARFPDATLVTLEGAHASILMDALVRGGGPIPPAIERFLPSDAPSSKTHPSPGAVRTVLFTDVVGHTEMMSRLGDERGREVLREHERITREVLKAHGATEVKTMGDGFMASSGSVTRAVECAVALQRAFEEKNASAPEPLQVRVGLNAGEPVEEEGDLFGSSVILAARIAAKAGPGEILIPEPVRHLLAGKQFTFADRGEHVMKGFADAVRLYGVTWREGYPPEAPSAINEQSMPLTAREVEVLSLLAGGCSGKEIAAQLTVSLSTVQRHIANVYAKIGARGRVEAAAYALARGLAQPRDS